MQKIEINDSNVYVFLNHTLSKADMEHRDTVKKVLPLKDEKSTTELIGIIDKLDKTKVKDIASPSKVKKELHNEFTTINDDEVLIVKQEKFIEQVDEEKKRKVHDQSNNSSPSKVKKRI
jgi:hypothetical protein